LCPPTGGLFSFVVKYFGQVIISIVRYKKRFFERKVAKLQSQKEKLKVFVLAFFLLLLNIRYLKLCGFAFTLCFV
jgi:hypothetical protein